MEEFYKKKIIRDFLALFSESKWKNLSILLIEYAILTLRKNYQVSSLSLEDIEEFVNDMIEEEERKKKKNFKKLNNNQNNISNNKSIQTSHLNSSNNRPSSNWRKGETKTIFDVENNNNNKNNNQILNNINTESLNNDSIMTRMSKVKMIDEILYPKQNKFTNYKKDNIFNDNNNKKQNYKTTYNNTYTKKLIETPNKNSNTNIRYKRNLSNSSSSSNLKFKSGLQMLKMGNNINNNRATSSNKNLRNNSRKNSFSNNNRKNYNFVPSKIKAQVEADKKIYEMLKKNKKREEKKELEDYESSITYKKSENMSFEDELSSFM